MPNKKIFLKIFSLALFLSLTIFFLIKAAPPNTPYLPGETLDPNCAPGDPNCTVYPPAISTRQIQTTSPLTGGGDLSQDRTLSLIGLSGLGQPNQILSINSQATALEYKNITSLLTAGAGISISGTATAEISNTGILSLTAGPGISISSGQNPTITNIGVLSLNSATGTLTLQGTTNQINVATSTGTITFSLPQDIHTGASPTFANLTISDTATTTNLTVTALTSLATTTISTQLIVPTITYSGTLTISPSSNATTTITGPVILASQTGNVGIGTTSPVYKLDVSGDLRVSGQTIFSGVAYTWPSSAGSSGQVLTTDGTGNLGWTSAAGGVSGSGTQNYLAKWTATTTLGNSIIYDNGTSVGIGTTGPAASLHVAGGDIELSDGTSGFRLHSRAGTAYDFFQLTPKTGGTIDWSKALL